MGKVISGIQQIGIGIPRIQEAFDWYRKAFGVDLKIFDKRTGKMFVRGRDFVTEYDIINGYYKVRTYTLYEE